MVLLAAEQPTGSIRCPSYRQARVAAAFFLAEFVLHLPNEFPTWLVNATVKCMDYKRAHTSSLAHTLILCTKMHSALNTHTDAHSSPMRHLLSLLTVESDVSS